MIGNKLFQVCNRVAKGFENIEYKKGRIKKREECEIEKEVVGKILCARGVFVGIISLVEYILSSSGIVFRRSTG